MPTCTDGAENGDETGVDCGGTRCPTCPVLLLLGGGGTSLITGEYDPASGAWTVASTPGTTVDRPALTMTAAGTGVGLIRASSGVPAGALRFLTWDAAAGGWGSIGDVAPGATTLGAPSIGVGASGAKAAYLQSVGGNYEHRYVEWAGGAWGTPARIELTGGGAIYSYGPTAPAITATGEDAALAFLDGSTSGGATANRLVLQSRVSSEWQPTRTLAENTNYNTSPEIVTLDTSRDRLVVYVGAASATASPAGDGRQIWSVRENATTGGIGPKVPISTATTLRQPVVAALRGGGAMLAYQSIDGKLYTSLYDGTGWSAPVGTLGSPPVAVDIVRPPALARGVGNGAAAAQAELVYVTTGGVAHHIRYIGGSWGGPTTITTSAGLSVVALAGAP